MSQGSSRHCPNLDLLWQAHVLHHEPLSLNVDLCFSRSDKDNLKHIPNSTDTALAWQLTPGADGQFSDKGRRRGHGHLAERGLKC